MASRVEPGRILLIDTNVFIASEEYGETGDTKGCSANEALRIAQAHGYVIHVSNGTIKDLERSGNRSVQRSRQLSKYPVVKSEGSSDLCSRAGFPLELDANDRCDLEILGALEGSGAAWLLSDDRALAERARKAGISNVIRPSDFIKLYGAALDNLQPIPGVREVKPANVSLNGEIFASLFKTYPEFRQWWTDKVVAQNRSTLIIGSESDPLGIAVLKENDPAYGLPAETAKVCTFKISELAGARHYGELLLDVVVRALRSIPVLCAFVEVAPDQRRFIAWLEDFGFYKNGYSAPNGDLVLVKELSPSMSPSITASWDHHKRFGPGAVRVNRAFLVPIKQGFHERLFPSTDKGSLFYGLDSLYPIGGPCGNAIRKVYICNSFTDKIKRGDLLVFVVSGTRGGVSNIGVVESTCRSRVPVELRDFAGDRTVYSPEEIKDLASHPKGALAIRFRRDRSLTEPWGQHLEGYNALISSPVQSICSVNEEGIEWLRKALHS